jgi:hypothetical protein
MEDALTTSDGRTNGLDLNPPLFEAILKKLAPTPTRLVRRQQTPAANVDRCRECVPI